MSPALLLVLAAGACPASAPVPGSHGLSAVAKLPSAAAMRENAAGKKLYRKERFAEAGEKYRAALAADPDFLDARLNLACSLSREGRYGQAALEAASLVRAAYVPWQREVHEAADLAIVEGEAQNDYAKIAAAMAEEARAWGDYVLPGVLFVARTKPPINVTGQGVLLLGLNQEIFAWSPDSGRYFQVTAEDGHVLGFVRSADKRRVAYVLGGKVVHEPGQADRLRGLSLRVLEIPGMRLGPSVPIAEDVVNLTVAFAASPEILLLRPDGSRASFRLGEAGWEASPGLRPSPDTLLLTSDGVQPAAKSGPRPGCAFRLAPTRTAAGLWQIEVRRPGGKAFPLDARYGAALPGLPFPRPENATARPRAMTSGNDSSPSLR